MFFNLYAQSQQIEKHPRVTFVTLKATDSKTSWSNVRYAQIQKIKKTTWSNVRYALSQKIEKHPGVTSGTLKVKRLKNFLE
jgi:hypothetical protein